MKDIEGYEGLYAITSCGRVWSYYTERFLKPTLIKGYLRVDLYKDGKAKHFLVHQLVAKAYLPNPNNWPIVNHKDEVRLHCWLNNLEWCTYRYNNTYGTRNSRISTTKYKRIRCIETKAIYASLIAAGDATGILRTSISNCLCGKSKTAGGYHWEFC